MNIIYYVEVNLICIFLLLLFGNLLFHKIREQSSARMIFDCIMITAVFFCLSDMIAGIFRGRMFYGARTILDLSNWLYYETLAIISCLWFFYVLMKLNYNHILTRKRVLLFSLPLFIYSLVALINFFNGFMFSINEQNLYVRGKGIVFHWILTWGYLSVSTIVTVITYIREKNRVRKNEIRPLMYFIIAPALTAAIQMMFYGVTSTQVGITMSIVMISISRQNAQILTDPLTGLHNRRGLNYNFDNYIAHTSELPLTLMMIDINGFKKFNDTYGHVVGDSALIEVANVLKNVCKESGFHLFICRYGGDEFLIAGFFEHDAQPESLKQAIYDSCSRLYESGKLPCPLNVSIGYQTALCHNNRELEQLLSQADIEMYREKKIRKQ